VPQHGLGIAGRVDLRRVRQENAQDSLHTPLLEERRQLAALLSGILLAFVHGPDVERAQCMSLVWHLLATLGLQDAEPQLVGDAQVRGVIRSSSLLWEEKGDVARLAEELDQPAPFPPCLNARDVIDLQLIALLTLSKERHHACGPVEAVRKAH
jgi:hypothetical protein